MTFPISLICLWRVITRLGRTRPRGFRRLMGVTTRNLERVLLARAASLNSIFIILLSFLRQPRGSSYVV